MSFKKILKPCSLSVKGLINLILTEGELNREYYSFLPGRFGILNNYNYKLNFNNGFKLLEAIYTNHFKEVEITETFSSGIFFSLYCTKGTKKAVLLQAKGTENYFFNVYRENLEPIDLRLSIIRRNLL